MSVTFIEPHSPTWRAVEAWAKARLETYERRLKQPGVLHDETEGLRYAIREIEQLLNLSKPSAIPQFPPSTDPSF